MPRNRNQSALEEGVDITSGAEMSDTETAETPVDPTTETTEAPPAKQKKDPLPEGYVTPVALAKEFSKVLGEELKPQMVYGYLKNAAGFPVERNTDGHFMVNLEKGLAWYAEYRQRQAARASKRAAKEAEAKASEQATPAPSDA